jgi:hypothetical protein
MESAAKENRPPFSTRWRCSWWRCSSILIDKVERCQLFWSLLVKYLVQCRLSLAQATVRGHLAKCDLCEFPVLGFLPLSGLTLWLSVLLPRTDRHSARLRVQNKRKRIATVMAKAIPTRRSAAGTARINASPRVTIESNWTWPRRVGNLL